VANVRLEYSTDDFGPSTFVIEATTPNSSPYSWPIPNDVSSSVKVKIMDVNDPADAYDISDNYFCITGPPHHLAFVTESRKLIAGTTIQFYGTVPLGVEVATAAVSATDGVMPITLYSNRTTTISIITVEIRDIADTVVVSTENTNVRFECIDSPTAFGDPDPGKPLDTWNSIGPPSYLSSVILTGNFSTSMYCYDTIAGTYTLRASAENVSLVASTQSVYITPAPIRYFTVEHPYAFPTPLSAHNPGLLTVKTRDRYGNVAAGDSLNGQYYDGTIQFSHSGTPGKVTLADFITMESSYTFTRLSSGTYNELLVTGQIQENLQIFTTHYSLTTVQALDLPVEGFIFGNTNDFARGMPVSSDDDVSIAGIVVTPDDLAPEDPLNPTKQALLSGTPYEGNPALSRGDGETDNVPYPIPMLRLRMKVLPAGISKTGILDQIRADKLGTLFYGDVTELELYHDVNSNGIFEGETILGGSSVDTKITTAAYNIGDSAWYFDSLSIHSESTITDTEKIFFICVRISTDAAVPATLGLELTDYLYIALTGGSTATVTANNFAIKTTTSQVAADLTPPTAAILDPQDNSYKNSLTAISGTAWDNISISTVQVSIKISTSGGNYWDGSAFSSPTQIWRNYNSTQPVWGYPFGGDSIPAWVDGSTYTIIARAYDSSNNYSTIYATNTFTYDINLPTAAVTFPVDADFHGPSNPLPTISGTSADDTSGATVEILIRDLTQGATYWNGSSWIPLSSWVVCTGTNSWAYTSPLWNDGQYQITPRAIDFASNISSNTPVNFIYDATNPTTEITLPDLSWHNSLTTISGTADDALPGELNQVQIRIYNEATIKYWNTVTESFDIVVAAAETAWFVAKPSITWSVWYTTSPPWNTDTDYRVEAKSQDKALNWDMTYSTFSFIYDTSTPNVEITYPVNDSYIKSLTAISGTSFDFSGSSVSILKIAIRENSIDKWWDGVSFSSDTLFPIDVNPPFDNWTYPGLTSSELTANTSYYITCYIIDNATNELGWYIAGSTFTYIPSATQLQVLLPGEASTPGIPPGKSGPAADQFAGVSFDITVNAVDDNWYIDTTTAPIVTVTTSDAYDADPGPNTLVNGTRIFSVALVTAQISSITATAVGLSSGTTGVNVLPSLATKLQLLVPDEYSVPGSPAGKSGTVATQVVGTTFTVTVNGTDAYWNKDTAEVTPLDIDTSDLSDTEPLPSVLISGTRNFDICFKSSGTWDISATDTAGPFLAPYTSPLITVYPPVPNAPTGFAGTSLSTTSIKWQWADNELFEDGYILRTSTDGIIKTLSVNATAYTEKNLNPNTTYSRYAEVYNVISGTTSSNTDTVYTLANPPTNSRYAEVYNVISGTTSSNTDTVYTLANPPTNLTSPNQTTTTVELSWTEGDGGNSAYYVEISTDGSNYTTTVDWADSLTVENYTVTGLISGTTYFFRAGGYNGDGYATTSSTIQVKVEAIPNAPTGFAGNVLSTTSIKWQWTDNELFEDGYILRTSTDGIINSRYAEVYNVISGTTSSNTDTVYTLANPPTNLTSPNQTITTVELSWTEGDGGNTAYYIEISTYTVNYSTIVGWSDSLSATNYTVTDLNSDTTYFFRVGGYNGDGSPTIQSNTLEIKTEEVPPDTIFGKVTQSDYTPITGVAAIASLNAQSWTVYTSTDGTYAFTGLIYSTCYIITCEWTVNDIKSSVFRDNIGTGSDKIDFTLEVTYELATIIGYMDVAAGLSSTRRSMDRGHASSYSPRVELIQNGKVIAKVCIDNDGNYTIPNLLPGKYTLRAYNGQIYSSPEQISLAEGQNSVVIIKFDIFPGEEVYAYPNPVKSPDSSVTIRFYYSDTLPTGTEIKIYNIAAELVKTIQKSELEVDGDIYKYEWDFTQDKVASGIYIYQIKIPGEKTASKKLGIIK
jgi:hypothetical protein